MTRPLVAKGHFKFCFRGGALTLFLGVLVTSYCTKLWQLIVVQGLLSGMGMGLIFGPGVPLLMIWFSKHIGLASGLASMGGSVGKHSRAAPPGKPLNHE